MLENQIFLKGTVFNKIEMECPVILESSDATHLQRKNISSDIKSENLYHRKSLCRFKSCQNESKTNWKTKSMETTWL